MKHVSPNHHRISPAFPDRPIHKTLGLLWLVAMCALIAGAVIPGIAAKLLGTYNHAEILAALQTAHPEDASALRRFEQEQSLRRASLDSIQHELETVARTQVNLSNVHALIEARDALQGIARGSRPPIRIESYAEDHIRYLFPMMMMTLGWLAIAFRPNGVPLVPNWNQLGYTFAALVLFHRWPTWLRNLGIIGGKRVVYADANWDMSHGGFISQELQTWLIMFLFALILCHSSTFLTKRLGELRAYPDDLTSNATLADSLATTFAHWQITSLVLAAGFICYTVFFWNLIARWHDFRYLPAALEIHALWGACWIVMSLPLAATWHHWHVRSIRILAVAAQSAPERAQVEILATTAISPLPFWNVFGSAIAALLSFLFPLLQLLR